MITKCFHIDIGREVDENDKSTYHAHFISVPDRKIGVKAAPSIHKLMQSLVSVMREKEKENILFPVEEREPSSIILPNGRKDIHDPGLV